eukprot:COSAG01_NODE_4736_length_4783_cov_24.168019_2_plen_365_part_00
MQRKLLWFVETRKLAAKRRALASSFPRRFGRGAVCAYWPDSHCQQRSVMPPTTPARAASGGKACSDGHSMDWDGLSPPFEYHSTPTSSRGRRWRSKSEFHVSASGAPFRVPADFVPKLQLSLSRESMEQSSSEKLSSQTSSPHKLLLSPAYRRGLDGGSTSARVSLGSMVPTPPASNLSVRHGDASSSHMPHPPFTASRISPRGNPVETGLPPSPRAWYLGGRGERRGSMGREPPGVGGHMHYFGSPRPRVLLAKLRPPGATSTQSLLDRAATMRRVRRETESRLLGQQFVVPSLPHRSARGWATETVRGRRRRQQPQSQTQQQQQQQHVLPSGDGLCRGGRAAPHMHSMGASGGSGSGLWSSI